MKRDFKFFWTLFVSTFTLSAFTFGGGYVIVPLMRKKFVETLKWIEEDEMMDLISIAQSAPGPIAVNSSIIIGYRLAGVPGALVTVFGTVLPPMVVLSVISQFYTAFRDNVIRILGSYSDNVEPTEYDEKIDALQKQMLALIEDSAKTESADEEFDRAYREITDQIRAFTKKRTELSREKQLAEAYDQRVEGMGQYIQKTNYLKRQFDDELVRRLIKAIMVISEDKIEIQFHSGIVMTQRINEYD